MKYTFTLLSCFFWFASISQTGGSIKSNSITKTKYTADSTTMRGLINTNTTALTLKKSITDSGYSVGNTAYSTIGILKKVRDSIQLVNNTAIALKANSASPNFTGSPSSASSFYVGATNATSATLHVQGTTNTGIWNVYNGASTTASGAGSANYISFVPSAQGHRLGFMGSGYLNLTTSAAINSTVIASYSNQPWSVGTAQGSYMTLETTPNNSATRAVRLTITANGEMQIGSVTAAPDTPSIGSFYLYVEGNSLKAKGSSGTVTTLALP